MNASRSSLSETRQSLSGGWIGIVKKPSRMAPCLFDCLRVDRRAGGARDHQRRAAEEEFVDCVGGAILGELSQVEHLAHVQAHGRNHHPMPGLVDVLGLVGTD